MNEIKKKKLFLEINDENFIFLVGMYNEEMDFEITEKLAIQSSGIQAGIVNNLENALAKIYEGLEVIENKTNQIFNDVNIIIDYKNLECLKVTSFKKFNGSQISKEDISFILNDIKRVILENEKNKTIIQIFNTKFIFDKNETDNLPIGLYGDFYNHELSFFLVKNNELKNLKSLLNKCNLTLDKIHTKSFLKGVQYINSDEEKQKFCLISIQKKNSYISIFYKSSYIYFESFNFGTDIILQDVAKVCSLDNESIFKIIKYINENPKHDSDELVKKEYFTSRVYRKIRLSLIEEIISARIEEIIDLILKKNINLKNYNLDEYNTNINFKNLLLFPILKRNIQNLFRDLPHLKLHDETEEDQYINAVNSAHIYLKGWQKEAVPVVSQKKSTISKIFSFLFE